jgi:hypothetical protein
MILDALIVNVTLDLSGRRIQLPKQFSDRLTWLRGSDAISAWLWIISPGGYRLLSDEQAEADPNLELLRSLFLGEELMPSSEPTAAKKPEDAAVVAMLYRVELKSSKSYWRLTLPTALNEFIPQDCDGKKFSISLSLEGYLEIWYTDILRKALFAKQNLRS